MPNGQKLKRVCFNIDDKGWIYLSDKIGKITLRAYKMGKIRKKATKGTSHRAFEFDCWKTVKVKSKQFDISQFTEK
ncbi:MAG: hypothetical protein ACKKMV_00300 [Candidatus Nealsonbacteria bacterium]